MRPTGLTTWWRSVHSLVQLAELSKTPFVRMDWMELLQNSIRSFSVKDHGVGGAFAHPEVFCSEVAPVYNLLKQVGTKAIRSERSKSFVVNSVSSSVETSGPTSISYIEPSQLHPHFLLQNLVQGFIESISILMSFQTLQ